jgi:hypothetical protein
MPLVLTPAEDDAAHLDAPIATRGLGHCRAILTTVEALDLPEVWLDARLLELPDNLDHQRGTPLMVVPLAITTHLVQLLWHGRHEQLEHILAVVGMKIFA